MFTAAALILTEIAEAAFTVSSVVAIDTIIDTAAPALTEWIGATSLEKKENPMVISWLLAFGFQSHLVIRRCLGYARRSISG